MNIQVQKDNIQKLKQSYLNMLQNLNILHSSTDILGDLLKLWKFHGAPFINANLLMWYMEKMDLSIAMDTLKIVNIHKVYNDTLQNLISWNF